MSSVYNFFQYLGSIIPLIYVLEEEQRIANRKWQRYPLKHYTAVSHVYNVSLYITIVYNVILQFNIYIITLQCMLLYIKQILYTVCYYCITIIRLLLYPTISNRHTLSYFKLVISYTHSRTSKSKAGDSCMCTGNRLLDQTNRIINI